MEIIGLDGIEQDEFAREIENGARFVTYQYCVSILVMTFKRSSDIYFIRAGEGRFGKGIGMSFMSLLLGWWGLPWGPIYTIGALFSNCTGGTDVTNEVLDILYPQSVAHE